jgi:hypothetical protein
MAACCAAAIGLAACGGMSRSEYRSIPAGYVGKVLTPTGWQKGVLEAGQVNLGGTDADNRNNSLVLLEASGTQVKEIFPAASKDDEQDHRIITTGAEGQPPTPVAVDVYIRLRVPVDERLRNRVFAEITPIESKDDVRVTWITVESIYNRFVHQEARSIIRRIIGAYANDLAINAHRQEIEQKLTEELLKRLEELKVPLELQSVALSNVTPDPLVQKNRSEQLGASSQVASIEQVGAALAHNPGYVALEQVKAMERVSTEAAKAGHPPTFIIGIDGPGGHSYAARSIP